MQAVLDALALSRTWFPNTRFVVPQLAFIDAGDPGHRRFREYPAVCMKQRLRGQPVLELIFAVEHRRYRGTVLAHSVQMEIHSLPDVPNHLFERFAGTDHALQFRQVRTVILTGIVYFNNYLFHICPQCAGLFQPGLFQNRIYQHMIELVALAVVRYRDPSRLSRMLVLAMTAPLGHEIPAVSLYDLDHLHLLSFSSSFVLFDTIKIVKIRTLTNK